MGVSVGFDGFDQLRAAMFADTPALAHEGLADLRVSVPAGGGDASGVIENYPIADPYLTNPILRASPTMQRCSSELWHGETVAEAAA